MTPAELAALTPVERVRSFLTGLVALPLGVEQAFDKIAGALEQIEQIASMEEGEQWQQVRELAREGRGTP